MLVRQLLLRAPHAGGQAMADDVTLAGEYSRGMSPAAARQHALPGRSASRPWSLSAVSLLGGRGAGAPRPAAKGRVVLAAPGGGGSKQ